MEYSTVLNLSVQCHNEYVRNVMWFTSIIFKEWILLAELKRKVLKIRILNRDS
jgi:hypothetical protein